MFIDIHVHTTYWKRKSEPPYFYSLAAPEELIAGYDSIGVEKAALLPLVSPEAQCQHQSNEEILAICAKYPDRFVPFCNIDPRSFCNSIFTPMADILKHYKDLGCRGVGEVTANLDFLNPMVQNLFAGAQEMELPLTFHISPEKGVGYGLVDQAGLPQLEESLRRFPKLIFLGHSQTFWGEISKLTCMEDRYNYPKDGPVEEGTLLRLMRTYPNLYGDLSAFSGYHALKRDRAYAAKFLTEFQDRLLYGTDICTPEMPILRPLADLLTDMRDKGEITQEIFEKVARKNAERLLKLA